jgi:hypothetical protein
MEREPRKGTVRGNKRASWGLILLCGGGKGGHRSGRSTTSALPGSCLPLEEEDIGETGLGFYWAKTGLPFGPEQRREKKNYFLVTNHFLSSIY